MAKYLEVCKNCKMDCKDGLLDLKNKPHKIFSSDDYLVRDFWCSEFQYLLHEKVETEPYAIQIELSEEDIDYLLDDAEALNDLMESI